MALATINFSSEMLKKQTEICMCLPNPGSCNISLSKRKVLWLLHGLSDDNTCWHRFSNVERYANESGIIVVMPNGDRSMYEDNVLGQNYMSFISEELPAYLHNVFSLSDKRDDNFIAGLSMGGMGAAKIALTHYDRYAGFGSFSGLLDINFVKESFSKQIQTEFPFMKRIFDSPDFAESDPKTLLSKKLHSDMKMFVACGTDDYWMRASTSFKEKADRLGLNVRCSFDKGGHEWRLWDKYVKEFIDYINE